MRKGIADAHGLFPEQAAQRFVHLAGAQVLQRDVGLLQVVEGDKEPVAGEVVGQTRQAARQEKRAGQFVDRGPLPGSFVPLSFRSIRTKTL